MTCLRRRPGQKLTQAQRVQACLFEAGFHRAEVMVVFVDDAWRAAVNEDMATQEAIYMAFLVSGEELVCWTCWLTKNPEVIHRCLDGRCETPDAAKKPPRKALVGV